MKVIIPKDTSLHQINEAILYISERKQPKFSFERKINQVESAIIAQNIIDDNSLNIPSFLEAVKKGDLTLTLAHLISGESPSAIYDFKGKTMIDLAASLKHTEMVKMMLPFFSNISAQQLYSFGMKEEALAILKNIGSVNYDHFSKALRDNLEYARFLFDEVPIMSHLQNDQYIDIRVMAEGKTQEERFNNLANSRSLPSSWGAVFECQQMKFFSGQYNIYKYMLKLKENQFTRFDDAMIQAFIALQDHEFDKVYEIAEQNKNSHRWIFCKVSFLFACATHGDVKTAKLLIERGADVNATIKFYRKINPLVIAASNGHYEIVKLLLNNGEYKEKYIQRALDGAADNKHADIVRLLMKLKKALKKHKWTRVLNFSCSEGYLDITKTIMENWKENPLILQHELSEGFGSAAVNGHLKTVEYILDYGFNFHSLSWMGRNTFLEVAKKGLFDVIKLIVEKDIDLTQAGIEFFIKVCQSGHAEVVQYLIDTRNYIPDFLEETLKHITKKATLDTYKIIYKACPYSEKKKYILFNAFYQSRHEIAMFLIEEGEEVDLKEPGSGKSILNYACENGWMDIVKILEERGVKLDSEDSHNEETFFFVCTNGNPKMVKYLIDKGISVNSKFKDGRTALMAACTNGHLRIAKLLVEKGANINFTDHEGRTALYCASRGGFVNIVRLLLDKGASITINKTKKDVKNALIKASSKGHFDVVKLLIERGADVNAVLNIKCKEKTALFEACLNGYDKVARLLIDNGAEIESKASHSLMMKNTFIDAATKHFSCTKLLIEKGINIEKYGTEILARVVLKGKFDEVKYLIDNGFDVATYGRIALVKSGTLKDLDIMGLLIESGANLNFKDSNILQRICSKGSIELAEKAISRGIDLKLYGKEALEKACSNGFIDIVKLLLDNGVDPERKCYSGFREACKNGYIEVLQLLLERGYEVSKVNVTGLSPLEEASSNGWLSVVKLLVENGMKPQKGALISAALNGHKEIFEYLIEKIEVDDDTISTMLSEASSKGYSEIVREVAKLSKKQQEIVDAIIKLSIANRNNIKIITEIIQNNANQGQTFRGTLFKLSEVLDYDVAMLLFEHGSRIDLKSSQKYIEKYGLVCRMVDVFEESGGAYLLVPNVMENRRTSK